MEKTYEEIKENIEDLDLNETETEELISNISKIEDETQKKELIDLYVKKLKEKIINSNDNSVYSTKEQFEDMVNLYKNQLINAIPLAEEILIDNNFNFENIYNEVTTNSEEQEMQLPEPVNQMEKDNQQQVEQETQTEQDTQTQTEQDTQTQTEQSEKEIDKITRQIKEIESAYLNISLQNDIISKLDKLYGEIALKAEKTDEEKALQEQLEEEIKNIGFNDNYLSLDELKQIYEKYNISYEETVTAIKKNNPEIKDEISNLEQVNSEIQTLTTELATKENSLSEVEQQITTLESVLAQEEDKLKELQQVIETKAELTEKEKEEVQQIEAELERRNNQDKPNSNIYANLNDEALNKNLKNFETLSEKYKPYYLKAQEEIQKITQELEIKNNPYANLKDEELESKIKELFEKEQKNSKFPETLSEIRKQIYEMELEQERRKQGQTVSNNPNGYTDMSIDDLNQKLEYYKNLSEKYSKIQEQIKQTKEEQERRESIKNANNSNDYANMDIEELEKRYNKLVEAIGKNSKEAYKYLSELEEVKEVLDKKRIEKIPTEDLKNRLEELKNKKKQITKATPEEIEAQQKIVNDKKAELEAKKNEKTELEKNIGEIKQKITNLNESKKDIENLRKLQNYEKTYNIIKNQGIRKFDDHEENENLTNDIMDFINNHPDISVFDDYEQKDKLKNELAAEIESKVKEQVPIQTEKNEKIWTKALAGVSGFVVGLGMSCVPGVGQIRMGIAGAKLITSAVNCYAEKHEDSFIAKIVSGVKDKYNEFSENHPKITNAVNKARAFLKNRTVNCFLNGVSVGYITGNIVEMVSGKTILDHIKPESVEPESISSPVSSTAQDVENNEIAVNDTPIPPTIIDSSEIELNPGEVFDISMLKEGYTSSGAEKAVSLMEEIGKNVEVDKFNIINGEKWVHFKQLNGKGYAWFKLKDVQEALAETIGQASSKTL